MCAGWCHHVQPHPHAPRQLPEHFIPGPALSLITAPSHSETFTSFPVLPAPPPEPASSYAGQVHLWVFVDTALPNAGSAGSPANSFSVHPVVLFSVHAPSALIFKSFPGENIANQPSFPWSAHNSAALFLWALKPFFLVHKDLILTPQRWRETFAVSSFDYIQIDSHLRARWRAWWGLYRKENHQRQIGRGREGNREIEKG